MAGIFGIVKTVSSEVQKSKYLLSRYPPSLEDDQEGHELSRWMPSLRFSKQRGYRVTIARVVNLQTNNESS